MPMTALFFLKGQLIRTGLVLWSIIKNSQCTKNFTVSVFSLYMDKALWIAYDYYPFL